MKKFLVAIGLAALVASQAQAFELKSGDFQIHLRDATSFYVDHDQNPQTPMIPRRSPVYGKPGHPPINPADGYAAEGPQLGDELRAVSLIDSVDYAGVPPLIPGMGKLVALTYDATLVSYNTDPLTGLITAAYTGGKMQFWLDQTVEDLDGLPGTIDTGDIFNPRVGVNAGGGNAPLLWTENGRPEGDTYEGVNAPYPMVAGEEDASLWLDVAFLPRAYLAGVPITIIQIFDPATGFGSSLDAFLDVLPTPGTVWPSIISGVFNRPPPANADGLGKADLLLAFTSRSYPSEGYDVVDPYAFLGGWQAESSDPIQGKADSLIPEPASISLLGLGIAALLGYRRRQK